MDVHDKISLAAADMVSAESVGGDVAESRRVLSGLKCYESATLQRIYITGCREKSVSSDDGGLFDRERGGD